MVGFQHKRDAECFLNAVKERFGSFDLELHPDKTRKGSFVLGRKPVAKQMRRTLKRIKEELRRRMHVKVAHTAKWLGKVLNGWLNYYAVPNSFRYLSRFVFRLERLWLRTLRRRSQKDRCQWSRIQGLRTKYWPKLKIRHPWPWQRFAVTTQGRSPVP